MWLKKRDKMLLVYTDGQTLFFATSKEIMKENAPENSWFIGEVINSFGIVEGYFER